MKPDPVVVPAGFEQQYADPCIGGEAVGEDATRRAGANDDVVVLAFAASDRVHVPAHTMVSRGYPRSLDEPQRVCDALRRSIPYIDRAGADPLGHAGYRATICGVVAALATASVPEPGHWNCARARFDRGGKLAGMHSATHHAPIPRGDRIAHRGAQLDEGIWRFSAAADETRHEGADQPSEIRSENCPKGGSRR